MYLSRMMSRIMSRIIYWNSLQKAIGSFVII